MDKDTKLPRLTARLMTEKAEGGHWRVGVWQDGGKAGELTFDADQAEAVAIALNRMTPHAVAVLGVVAAIRGRMDEAKIVPDAVVGTLMTMLSGHYNELLRRLSADGLTADPASLAEITHDLLGIAAVSITLMSEAVDVQAEN